jgi:hypothetical protein
MNHQTFHRNSEGAKRVKIEIDQEIIDKAKKCKGNFACLTGEADCLGNVDTSDSGVLYIKSDANCKEISCAYCLPFANTFFCSCPTRNEIYRRYLI